MTGIALMIVMAAAVGYALYWIIRRAVAAGIRDAARSPRQSEERVDR